MKVLVTGGAGYIGSHTVRALTELGYDVVVLDSLQRPALQAVLTVPFLQTDPTDQEVIDAARKASGRAIPVEYTTRRPGDPVAIWADTSKAERELGWKAQYDLETIVQTA